MATLHKHICRLIGAGIVALAAATSAYSQTSLDMQIQKTLTPSSYTPGVPTNVTYTVTVTNLGPGNAVKAPIKDVQPPGMTFSAWTCTTSGAGNGCWKGASFAATQTGIGSVLPLTAGLPPFPIGDVDPVNGVAVDLVAGASATFLFTATAGANAYDLNTPAVNGFQYPQGYILNAASVRRPLGTVQSSSSGQDNVTAVFEPILAGDVGVTKGASIGNYTPGSATNVTYTFLVTNFSAGSPLAAIPVIDAQPAGVTFNSWSCAITFVGIGAAGSNVCPASGSGSINTTVDLKPTAVATFTVNATISAGRTGQVCNTITSGFPAGVIVVQTLPDNPDSATACINPVPITVTINKTVTGAPATGAPGAYNFSISCQTPTATYPASITLAGATLTGSTTVSVPAGSTNCVATETGVPGAPTNYTWGSPTITGGTMATPLFANATVGVNNPLTRNNVAVTITKNITGVAASVITGNLTFPFTLTCPGTVGSPFSGTVTVNAGTLTGTSAAINVPAGATGCTIAEGTLPTAPTNYTWGSPSYTQPPATLPATGTAAGTITNPLVPNPGTLTVNKTVTGAPAGGAPGAYAFSVNCSNPTATYTGSVTINGTGTTGSTTVINIPAGTTGCSIVETSTAPAPTNYSWGSPSYAQPAATALAAGGSISGTITNPLTRNNVVVTANKTVSGVTGNGTNFPFAAATSFPFTVTCTGNPGGSYAGTMTVAAGATTGTGTVSVPQGSTGCTASEGALPTAPTNYTWGTPVLTGTPLVTPLSAAATVGVNNPLTRNNVAVTITKNITGVAASVITGNLTFPFTLTCPGTVGSPFSGTVTVNAGTLTGTSAAINVPAGATGCTIAEGTLPTAPTNYTWGSPSYTQPPATLPATGTAAGTITNPLTRNNVVVTANKTVSGVTGNGTNFPFAAATSFPFTVTCTGNPGGSYAGTMTVAAGATTGTGTVSVPQGSTGCTASEGALPTAPTNYTWGTPVLTGTPLVTPLSAAATVGVNNPLTRNNVAVTITKNITGVAASVITGNLTFPFTLTCPGTVGSPFSGTVTVNAGTLTGTSAAINVPAGATGCTIAEGTLPTAPTNYTWGSPSYTQPPATLPATGTAAGTITNPLTRNNVVVTANKTVSGVTGNGTNFPFAAATSFPFTVTCTGNPGGSYAGTMTVAAGATTGTGTVSVPQGSTGCTASEGALPTAPTNYTWGTPVLTGTPLVTPLSAAATVGVNNPLTRNNVAVTITKNITGVAASVITGNLTFPFTLTCPGTVGSPFSGTVTVNAGTLTGTSAAINVPAGATGCTIAEGTLPTAPTNYTWGSPSYTQPPATLPATGTAAGTITNPLTRNNVVVTANKTVSGVTGNGTNFPFAAATSFPFTVTCTGNPGGSYAGTMTVAAGATTGTGTVSVPQGSTGCTASEGALPTAPTNYTWGTPVLTGTPLVTPLSAAATVGVNNPLTRNNVAVTITKNITGVAASVITGNLTFPFTLTCPGTVGSPFSGTVTVNAGTLTGTSAAINVPAGATGCTIAEGTLPTAPTNYTWGSPSYTQPPATLPATGTAAGTITNPLTRNNVVVTANKTVSGVTGNGTNFPFAAATSFPFTVTCTGNPGGSYAGTMTVAAGATTGTGTVSVPQGSTGCTASEGALPTAPTNYTWGTPVLTGTPLVTPLSAAATVGVNNPLTRNNVAVTITKNITGVAASVITGNLTFPFTLTCPGTVGSPFSGTVTVNAGTLTGTSAAINVPAGATGCTIAEGTLPTAPTNYTWGSPSYTQPPATLPATGTAAGTITNPLTRNNVVVTANKTVSGVTGNGTNFPFAAATSFPFTVTCTGNPGGSYAGTMTVAAGATTGTGTVSVPQGSTGCTASEGALPTAPTNYTWGTPVLTGTPLVTPLSAAATVGVNNPLTRNNVAVTITKNITGVAASVITGNLTFPFTLTCPGTVGSPFSGTVTVNAGTLTGTSAAINVPAGATGCTIAEGTLPTAPTFYIWGTATYTQPVATLPATGTATAAITNPLIQNAPNITVTKTITSAGIGSPVQYLVTVTNSGGPGTYTLTDTPLLGSGVTFGAVTCANTTAPAAGGTPNCAGAAPYSLAAAGTAIAGGASHTYTVSIPFTVTNAVTPTAGSALCPASAPTTSNGGLNNATTVTPNSGNASTVNVCRDITPNAPNITVTKTITSAGIASPVQYLVTVTNSGGPGTYTLTDTPLLGSGVTLGTVTCANTTAPAAGGTPNCAGAAPYSLAAAGTAIAGGASHTYTVSIPFTVTNAVTPTAGSALCPVTTPTTSAGGLNNATTVTPNSGNASTVNVCRDITPNAPNITVTKTITSAGIASPVQYLVTVTNSGGPGTYTLTDTPLLGSGVTLGAVTCANTTAPAAGGTPNCAGAAPYSLAAAGTAIAGGASHTYTVSIPFTVTNAVTPTAGSALCPASAPTTSNGGLNNATTVTPNSGNASTVNVCRDITPNAPNITVTKTITSAGIGSPVQYLVTVTNSGGPGTYTLTDTPLLGSGVTFGAVTCANTTAPAAGGTPNCAGAAPYSLAAAGTAIAGGASHTYTVSIPFTVTNAVTPTAGSALCPASAPTTSNGGLNNATTVTPNSGNASTVNVCRDITPNAPNITVTKTITSAGIGSPVQYLVTVTNSGGPGTYTLTDTPLLGSGVTFGAVTCANTTAPAAGGTPNCAGAAPYSLAAAGTAIAGGASHTYTVSIPFTVTNAVTPTAGSALCPASAPTTSNGGLNNATTVTPNSGNASTVNVCRDITPNAPNITVTKTITSAGIASPVQYLVTVTNSGGPGTYTLTDTPLLGSGVTLGTVTCANTTAPAAGGTPNCAGAAPYSLAAAGTAIAGGASHTYTVSIPFTVTNAVTPTAGSALCPASAPTTSNGGLNNATTVTPNSGNASTVNVCRDITPNAPNITVTKTITSAGIASPVQYLVTVTNSGGPGTYTLTDTPLLGSGVTLGTVTCANTTAPAAGGTPNCAGAAPYSLAAAGTAIAGGASHTYTVSIPFTVTNAVTPTAGSALCPASAPTTSNGGLNNATTVTPNSGNASTVNVCRDITPNAPNITVTKTITSAGIASPVQYLVTVTNSGGPGTYTLTDTPLLGSGVTLGAVTCANTTAPAAGGTPNCAGAAPYSLAAAGTAIAGGASHTYTVSIPFTVTNAVTPTAGSALCPASAPTTSNGGLNNATTVTPNSGNASTVNVCRDITPNAPNITVTKTITSAGIASPVQYLVTVTNSGGPGTYTLTDTPLLGSGVTFGAVTCANTTAPAAGGTPNCAGAAPYSLAAAGTAIAGGASHTYTVSIPFTVTNAVTPTAGSALCPASAPTTSNGGLNNATTVTPNSGNASTVNVCRDITPNAPNITVTKTITSAGIGSPVQYLVTVTNSGGPGTYTLTDTPLLGSGVTFGAVTCANTTAPAAGGTPNCAGAAPYSLAAAGTAIAGGASHTYTVSIPFTVTNAVTPTAGSALCPASAPTTSNGGLNNATTVTPNSGNASTVNVCRDITPNAPNITVTKTITSAGIASPVQYLVTVTNSGGPGTYTLTDTPLLGSGVTLGTVTCANTTAPAAGGTPNCAGAAPYSLAAAGTAIAGGASHTYTVSIPFTVTNAVTPTAGSALCPATAPTTSNGGLNNATTVTPNSGSAQTVNVCRDITPNAPNITVTKTITSAAGANPIAYLVTVTNSGGPGSYGLTDTPLFGTGLIPGVPVCVNTTVPAAGGTPSCTTGTGANTLAALGTAIAGGASHTYTVTIGYTITNAVTSTVGSALCATTAQTTTPGGLNNATTVTPNSGNATTVNACTNAPGRLSHTKVLGAGPTATATANQYTQVYTITVTNTGGNAMTYGLTDTPLFGVGTTVNGAVCTASGTGAAACATSVTGAAPWTVAAPGTNIDVGGTHTYTMTVTFTVDPALVTAAGSDCSLTTGSTTNTGLLNRATLTPTGLSAIDQEVCTPLPPNIRVTKVMTSVASASPAVYLVTVTNTGGAGTYGLTDTPLFGTGITATGITCANTTTPAAGGTPNCTLPTGSNTLAASGTAIANGASHTYTVTIPFTVTNAVTNTVGSGQCAVASTTTSAGGLNNAATVTPNAGGTVTVNTCRDVSSNPPAITVTKSVKSITGANLIEYLVTVTNTGGPGTYGLMDSPAFGSGIKIISVSCSNTTSPVAGGLPYCSGTAPHTLADAGTGILGGATHTYAVTIAYTLTEAVSDVVGSAICASGNPPGPGGLQNVVTLTPSSSGAISANACVSVTPPVNVPTTNRFVLMLLALALVVFGWQSKRRFS